MAEHAEPFRTVTGAQIAEAFGGLVPQNDRDVLQGGYADHMAAWAQARTPRSRAHLAGHRAPAGDPRLAGG